MFIQPQADETCHAMAIHNEAVFVSVVGKSDSEFVPPAECLAENILFVAHLNEEDTDLGYGSNFGPAVRLAAPGTNIWVQSSDGNKRKRTGGTFSAAIVAGAISVLAETFPELNGARLIERFFMEQTTTLSALDGKVDGGRVFLRAN